MHPFFKEFHIDGVKGLAIFPYKNKVKDMIYQLKGCNDYEMKYVFLSMFKKELKTRYKNYILIPSPSHKNAYEERGFNQVVEIFSLLGLPYLELLEKTEDISQHNLGFKERIQVSKIIKLAKKVDLTGKKVLLVDDIVTTGSTIKSSINLIRELNPKMIEILVVAKTEFTPEEKSKLDENYPILD